ncbi:MAG: hypothetical protein V1742_01220, partial [Pseudomonadota bacterium]
MKLFRILVLTVILAVLTPAVSGWSADDNLLRSAQKLLDAYGQGKMAEMVKAMDQLKAAGLSWQPSLTAPIKNLFECKDDENLRVLHGIYFFDTNYAALFAKKQEFLDFRNTVATEIHKRLLPSRRWGDAEPTPPEVVRSYVEDPADPARRDALLASLNKRLESKIRLAGTDPEVMDYLVDFFYGSLIEGLYVTLSLARDETIGPELVAIFNQQAKEIIQFDLALQSFEKPELAKMVNLLERDAILAPIKDLILQKKG